MGRQEESGCVIGRIIAPPAFPIFIRPVATDGPEHIAAQDESAETIHRALGKVFVGAIAATLLAEHGAEGLGAEEPLMQFGAALAQRIVQALFRTRAIAVERHCETG